MVGEQMFLVGFLVIFVLCAQVFAFWDVLVMGRVEECSMQCAAPGVPVELDDSEMHVQLSMEMIDTQSDFVGPSRTRAVPSSRVARIGQL
jgi:hypothetical protein